MGTLDARVAALAQGLGALVLIRGEAGVGKSRLLAEVTDRAAAGATTLRCRAVEGGGAYRPLADALLAHQRVAALPAPVTTMFVFGLLADVARLEPEAAAALREHGQDRLATMLRLPTPQPYHAPVRARHRHPILGVTRCKLKDPLTAHPEAARVMGDQGSMSGPG